MNTQYRELQPIIIDLRESDQLNEIRWGQFQADMQYIMQRMFGGFSSTPVHVRGSQQQISAFMALLGQEKNYMQKFLKHGLDNPQTYKSKYKLDSATKDFTRKTGIKWPFK